MSERLRIFEKLSYFETTAIFPHCVGERKGSIFKKRLDDSFRQKCLKEKISL